MRRFFGGRSSWVVVVGASLIFASFFLPFQQYQSLRVLNPLFDEWYTMDGHQALAVESTTPNDSSRIAEETTTTTMPTPSPSKPPPPPPLAVCTTADMEILKRQLPPPRSHCRATNCPHTSYWLDSYLLGAPPPDKEEAKQQEAEEGASRHSAIFVGCNKGLDAMNSLRLLSRNTRYDRTTWNTAMMQQVTNQTNKESGVTSINPGACGQERSKGKNDPLWNALSVPRPALVHCIEAMPITAKLLQATAQSLHIQDSFPVTNVAMSNADGAVFFPNHDSRAGIENQGIFNCDKYNLQPHLYENDKNKTPCTPIRMQSLDTFVQEHYGDDTSNSRIDFVSIDVEGFDRNVLLGATKSLHRIGYLEFEYHQVGAWKKPEANLSSVVTWLHNDFGFVCYWAGNNGRVWRLTDDCWQAHYNNRCWSNVACVNRYDPESHSLLARMEELFAATLRKGRNQK